MYKEKFFDIFKINEHDLSRLKGALDISHNGIFDGNYAYTDEFISIFIKIPRSILPKSVKLIIFDAHDPKKTETLTADLKYEDLEFSCFSLKSKI